MQPVLTDYKRSYRAAPWLVIGAECIYSICGLMLALGPSRYPEEFLYSAIPANPGGPDGEPFRGVEKPLLVNARPGSNIASDSDTSVARNGRMLPTSRLVSCTGIFSKARAYSP